MNRLARLAAAATLAVAAIGCPDRNLSRVEPVPSAVSIKDIPVSADLDILFVIDNSASTQDKQDIFTSNYGNFVSALQNFPTGRPNLHLAVVTTSVDVGANVSGSGCRNIPNQNGALQTTALNSAFTCNASLDAGARYISDITQPSGARETNYTGTLSDALSCISQVGTNGCGFEAPLEAMKRALDIKQTPQNAGFLRPGALLAVVILADEDDCSGPPALFQLSDNDVGKLDFRCAKAAYRCDHTISIAQGGTYERCAVRDDSLLYAPSSYADFLRGLKSGNGVAVAVIAGDPTTKLETGTLTFPDSKATQELAVLPSCRATINGNDALARPGIRLADFLAPFGDRGLFRTVCQSDYSGALADIGALLFRAISPCLEGQIDAFDRDAAMPGLQPACEVSDLEVDDAGVVNETAIPPCTMAADTVPDAPTGDACWWVASNPAACITPSALELRVERKVAAAPNTKVHVACALDKTK